MSRATTPMTITSAVICSITLIRAPFVVAAMSPKPTVAMIVKEK